MLWNTSGKTSRVFFPYRIYALMEQYNQEELAAFKQTHEVVVLDSAPRHGFVCLGCGNRGISGGLFSARGPLPVELRFQATGELRFQLNQAWRQQHLTKIPHLNPMDFFSGEAGGMQLRCENCGGLAVISVRAAKEHCQDIGCTGCYVCNNPVGREHCLSYCASCPMVEHAYSNNGLRESCADIQCGTLFLSDMVYNLTYEEIATEKAERDASYL